MKNPFSLFVFLTLIVMTPGCTSEFNLATGKEENLLYNNTDKEMNIGSAVAREIEKQLKFITDIDSNPRVQRVFDKITAVCDRKDIVYTIRIIDDETVNAFSIPGGFVYIHKGLLDKIKEDDQLAGVLGHEVGHITAKHALKRIQNSYGYLFLQVAAIGSGSANLAAGMNAVLTSLYFAYSREDEFQADQLGVKYMKRAGYDPNKIIDVLKILKKEEQMRADVALLAKTYEEVKAKIPIEFDSTEMRHIVQQISNSVGVKIAKLTNTQDNRTLGPAFQKNLVEAELFLPWSAQQLRGKIFASCEVLEERADDDGAFIRVRGESAVVNGLQAQLEPGRPVG